MQPSLLLFAPSPAESRQFSHSGEAGDDGQQSDGRYASSTSLLPVRVQHLNIPTFFSYISTDSKVPHSRCHIERNLS